MEVFERRFRVRASLRAVSAFHKSTKALKVLTPPPMMVQLHRGGEVADGAEAEFTLWLGPLPIRWVARHEDVRSDGFVDVQVRGPLRFWRHSHNFIPLHSGGVEVHDRVEFAHDSGLRGIWTRILFSKPALYGLFLYRAFRTQRGARRLEARVG